MTLELDTLQVKTVEVKADEPLVFPEEFRRGLGVEAGGLLTLIQLNGFVLVASKRLVSLELMEGIRRILNDKGVTLDDLLDGLTQVRQEIYQERYAPSAQAA